MTCEVLNIPGGDPLFSCNQASTVISWLLLPLLLYFNPSCRPVLFHGFVDMVGRGTGAQGAYWMVWWRRQHIHKHLKITAEGPTHQGPSPELHLLTRERCKRTTSRPK